MNLSCAMPDVTLVLDCRRILIYSFRIGYVVRLSSHWFSQACNRLVEGQFCMTTAPDPTAPGGDGLSRATGYRQDGLTSNILPTWSHKSTPWTRQFGITTPLRPVSFLFYFVLSFFFFFSEWQNISHDFFRCCINCMRQQCIERPAPMAKWLCHRLMGWLVLGSHISTGSNPKRGFKRPSG